MTEPENLQRQLADLKAAADNDARNGHRSGQLFDEKGKLVLPPVPRPDDVAGQCSWLTAVLGLTPAHPVTGGVREGRRGPDGHVAIYRASAETIRFEPATRINTPAKLIETLSWSILPIDEPVHTYTAVDCRQISYVVRMLCGLHDTLSAEQEAEGIIGTFLQEAAPVNGCTTYGTSAQRYEAATSLRHAVDEHTGRPSGTPRYLIDTQTGELVIAVSDLQQAARHHEGGSLHRGWLDARMEALGWPRVTLDGHSIAGRTGRSQGHHARIDAYRGQLHTRADAPDEPVDEPPATLLDELPDPDPDPEW